MRVRIERDALRAALADVRPAVDGRGLAVLSGVHIDAGDTIRLTATNLELTITAEVDGDADPGTLVVPHRVLSAFVDRAPDGAVTIEVADPDVIVTAGDSTAALRSLPVTEWPRLADVEDTPVVLSAEHVDLVRRTLHAVSADQKRPLLLGVHLEGQHVICTDSYRMAVATIGGADFPAVTIPGDAVKAALKGAGDYVEVTVGEHRARLSHGRTTWTTVLLEGEFPPVLRLLRDESPHTLTVPAERLTEALGRMGVLTGENTTIIAPEGDKAIVSARVADIGEVTDVVPCTGDATFQIGFNPQFLADLLEAAGTDDVTLGLVDAMKPAMVHAEGLQLLLMPVKVKR